MPAHRNNPRTAQLDKILRACFPGEKDGAMRRLEFPFYLLDALRLNYSPDLWSTPAGLRRAIVAETREALRQCFEQDDDEAKRKALLCVAVYYGGPLYGGLRRLRDDEVSSTLNVKAVLGPLLTAIGLDEKKSADIAMKKHFMTIDELPLLKNRGLALWVDALEQRYSAMVARSFENTPAWLRAAPLRLDGSKLLGRNALADEVVERAIGQSSNAEKVLLLFGHAGSGKTTELTRLFYQPRMENRYGGNRIWVSGEIGMNALEWRRRLMNVLGIPLNIPDTSWQLVFSETLKSRPWLIALDNCASYEFVQELAGFLPDMSLLVVTTYPGQAILLRYPEYARIQIEQLEEQEAWQIYLTARKKPAPLTLIEKDWVAKMVVVCRGNLLVLKIAFALAANPAGRDELLQVLQGSDPDSQVASLLRRFQTTSPDEVSVRATLLGALPPLAWADGRCFESLWNTDEQTTQGILSGLEQAGILTGLVDVTGRRVGWKLHHSVRAFFAESLGNRRESEHIGWRERYRIKSGRSGWLYQTTKKLGPVHFWKNHQEQALLLAAQDEKLGQPLVRGPMFWGLFPRAIQKMYRAVVNLFTRNPDLSPFFSVQWQQISLNSDIFSSERYISGYALENKFVGVSLANIKIGLVLIFLSPWLVVFGLPRYLPANLFGLILAALVTVAIIFLLLLFRLLPNAKDLNTMDAIYNLLWEAPAAAWEDTPDQD